MKKCNMTIKMEQTDYEGINVIFFVLILLDMNFKTRNENFLLMSEKKN